MRQELDAGEAEAIVLTFCSHLNYVSQDLGQYNGQGNGAGLQTESWDQSKLDIISDITSIPVPDDSFDAVMCIEVFEHIPEPVKVVKEFSRLLTPGGILIIIAPFCSLTHFAPYYFEVINALSNENMGSEEMLCFGLHVLDKKLVQ